ncbi:MAG: hypothetical protein GEU73_09190 [Chloroflexi bacterium]|nr:hypothetical protein [Chloroflexota bacterium]
MATSAESRTRAYRWRMPVAWWLKSTHYTLYMVRELTAVFGALWAILFLAQVPLMKADYAGWLSQMRSPGWVLFSFVSLLFVLYHVWTWFNLMGSVLYIRLGKSPIPGTAINALMFAVWAVASIVIALVVATPILVG